MSSFDRHLLEQTIKAVNFRKEAFVPSPQTQQAIAEAQQSGALPPPPQGQGQADPNQPQIGFPELMSLVQQGFEAVMGAQQQLAQMVQQQAALIQQMQATGAGGKAKKPSVDERISKLEQMLQQATGGAGAPPPAGPEGAEVPPPADPAAAAADPAAAPPAA